jgi:hypothetical protein
VESPREKISASIQSFFSKLISAPSWSGLI